MDGVVRSQSVRGGIMIVAGGWSGSRGGDTGRRPPDGGQRRLSVKLACAPVAGGAVGGGDGASVAEAEVH